MTASWLRLLMSLLVSATLATTLQPAHAGPMPPPNMTSSLADLIQTVQIRDDSLTTARRTTRKFVRLVNERRYREAERLTLQTRDLRTMKRFRKSGYRFGGTIHCDLAPPEGYQCVATVLRNGTARGTFWARVDGTFNEPWKVWDVIVALGE